MSEPGSRSLLQDIARQLAEVFSAASTMVSEVEQENRRREEAARRVADVLAKADSAARRRVMTARRTANAAELRAVQALADEMRYQAGARALAAINRYAGTLSAAADDLNQRRRAELDALGYSVGQVDQAGALALLRVVQAAEERRALSARQQAEDISAQLKAALGALPKPPPDAVAEPRGRRRRRRAHPAPAADAGESNDVVHLDPSRRRRAN